ncbi:biotin--[acetyl-CoA-carboxylase] ligase [soil metagenome]
MAETGGVHVEFLAGPRLLPTSPPPYRSSVSFNRARSALIGTRFGDLRSVAETGSTNADMLTLLRSAGLAGLDAPGPIVLIADHQTSGRGRLDRVWQAPPGASVLMSIGMPLVALPADRRSMLTTALSLAVTDATSELGIPEVGVKWPNDLVAGAPNHRKLGGILAEVHLVDGVGECVIAGVGLNVNWPEIPGDLADIATSMNQLVGHEVDRDDLVIALLRSLDQRWLPALEGGAAGLSTLGDAARDRSATLGRRVRVELPRGELIGVASDIGADGALTVIDDGGVAHTVTVGDVVHLRTTD